MFQDHYLKKPLPDNVYLPTADASMLYALIPSDALISEEYLTKLAKERNIPKAVNVLKDIGGIKKIVGVHLQKFCEKF